jgi:aminoglycoside phosphotransferase family enzyme/predicted kinase
MTPDPKPRGPTPQKEVLDFLADPRSFGTDAGPVERIETHGAFVFLVGERAYKVKRAVRYPYLDFSTLALRHAACEREVALNRRTAPDLYLGVEAIRRDGEGRLSFAAEGPVAEWAVVMRRFPQDQLLDRISERDRLTSTMIRDLADEVARFHGEAEQMGPDMPGGTGGDAFSAILTATLDELGEDLAVFGAPALAGYRSAALDALGEIMPLLDRRARQGRVRRCHGDLHLRNIVLHGGRPVLFDCIEFNDDIACIDVLYDLAFLLMDLQHRGHRREANLLLNRYLQSSDEELSGLAALPLFQSLRAAIRAKVGVTASSFAQREERAAKESEARDYLDLARRLIAPPPPLLVAVGGRSGSGKTRLAAELAPTVGAAPGALHLRSDVIRKQLLGVDELTRLPESAYRRSVTESVYATLGARARDAVAAGHAAIADAAFLSAAERAAIEAVAAGAGIRFQGLWLEAPRRVLAERVESRHGDASDADVAVVRLQAEVDVGEVTWTRIDASREIGEVVSTARGALERKV